MITRIDMPSNTEIMFPVDFKKIEHRLLQTPLCIWSIVQNRTCMLFISMRVSVFVRFFCESISLHKTYTVCYYVEQPRELFLCSCLTKRYEVLKQTRLVASHCGSHEVCIYFILVRVFEQPQVAHHR